MNNSKLVIDSVTLQDSEEDIAPKLRTEEARIVNIVEALQGVQATKEWRTLKSEVFDNLANVLERDLKAEAKKEDPDPKRLNRLAGELKWAEKYSDLSKLESSYRVQLQAIRIKLYGKE